MGKLNAFFFSLLIMVFVTTTNFMAGATVNNTATGEKSSGGWMNGFMGRIKKINPFAGSSSKSGHLSGASSQQTNVNGHVQGSTILYDDGKTSTYHSGHNTVAYQGSITCPNCHCHIPLSTAPSCMAQPSGEGYSKNQNTGSSASSNMQGSVPIQNNAAQSQFNIQNSNYAQSSANQFDGHANAATGSYASSSTNGAQSELASQSNNSHGSASNQENMSTGSILTNFVGQAAQVVRGRAKQAANHFAGVATNTHPNAATESYASSTPNGAQSLLASQSNNFHGSASNQENMSTGSKLTNFVGQAAQVVRGRAKQAASRFAGIVTNTHPNAATEPYASSITNGAQSQLASQSINFHGSAPNQENMSTGPQFTNLVSEAAHVVGDHALHRSDSMASSCSSSSSSSSDSSCAHNDHHHKCPKCGNSDHYLARSVSMPIGHSGSSLTGSTLISRSKSFSGNQFNDIDVTATPGATRKAANRGDNYIRSLSAASANALLG